MKEKVNTQMEDELGEFFSVLGLQGTRGILKSIKDGKDQYKDFTLYASESTLNMRTKQLIALGLIEHHLLRGTGKRREWYTLTEKGKRVLKAITELEKAFQGKGKSDNESC
jgi:DNA-binding HxlR family transcriptional regulator